ncbi:MAG TPA: nucleoside phosphorylase [Thermoanaerobacterales bacterium]|nr:nucleoside phosphorylase [Thermoanaerobacterales bacterium]
MIQPHILCKKGDIAENVILPGDPQRVIRAAEFLDEAREVAFNREFRTVTGKYKGVPVTITSTGIGGVSCAIAVEELIACGGKYFIRIGSAGALQPGINIGDLVIPIAAVREDGTSRMYVSENYPAVSDFKLTGYVIDTAKDLNFPHMSDIVRSHDTFYSDLQEDITKYWSNKGILASDMETATLYTVARLRGAKASCILNVVVSKGDSVKDGISQYQSFEGPAQEGEKREIILALETIHRFRTCKLSRH